MTIIGGGFPAAAPKPDVFISGIFILPVAILVAAARQLAQLRRV